MTNFSNSYNRFVLGLEQINLSAAQTPEQFVSDMEKMYNQEISNVTDYILGRKNKCRVVMLAGPSGSGKTTTAHMIKNEMERRGIKAALISLDDFYLGEGKAPLAEDGKHDYEAVEALDIEAIKSCIFNLIEYGYCDMPTFNFPLKRPNEGKKHVELESNGIAIIEGIHALNPIFTKNLPNHGLIKVYISVKQGISDYNGEILSRTDMRFLRRLVRDYNHRKTDAEQTLDMWDNVCRGEKLYIHPFKRTSDVTINSIHIYEPCVLCHMAIPLLSEITESSPHFKFARRILSSVERFYPIEISMVPEDSLLREFIGGGIY